MSEQGLFDDILLKPKSQDEKEERRKKRDERKKKKAEKKERDLEDIDKKIEKEEDFSVSEQKQKLLRQIENYRLSKYVSRKIEDRCGPIPANKQLLAMSEKQLSDLFESYRTCINMIDQKFLGSMVFNSGIKGFEFACRAGLKTNAMNGLSSACAANERIQELIEILSLEYITITQIKPQHALLFELGKTMMQVAAFNKQQQIQQQASQPAQAEQTAPLGNQEEIGGTK